MVFIKAKAQPPRGLTGPTITLPSNTTRVGTGIITSRGRGVITQTATGTRGRRG